MILHSKFNRWFVIIAILFFSGCSSLPKNDKVETKSVTEEGGKNKKISDGITTSSGLNILPVVADPMNKKIPSELTKIYKQIEMLVQGKNIEQAIQELNTTQNQFPKQSGPSYRIARLLLQKRSYDDALKAINKSLLIEPKNYYAHNLKGVIQRERGAFTEAKASYLQALTLFPRHPQSHLNLAILADVYLYDLSLALQHYEHYMSLTNNQDKKVNGWIIDLKRRM